MKKLTWVGGFIAGTMLFLFYPLILNAEPIQHHEMMVEADGSVQDCISSHDGALASEVRSCSVKCYAASSHPVSMDYPPKINREPYASAGEVKARGIKIVDGKVTCISCHNLRNSLKLHLDVEGQYLCQICHKEI